MTETEAFLRGLHPYDTLPEPVLLRVLSEMRPLDMAAGQPVYQLGAPLDGLYILRSGQVSVRDETGAQISLLGAGNSFGERGLSRDGLAVTSAHTTEDSHLLLLPRADFLRLIETEPSVRRFFDRKRPERPRPVSLATSRVEALMTRDVLTCAPHDTVQQVVQSMTRRHVSSVCVTDGPVLRGIVTQRDFAGKILATGRPGSTAVAQIMTSDPASLPPSALGSDVLHMMAERRIGHVPILEGTHLVGIVTQTDLTRLQATNSAELVRQIAEAADVTQMAAATGQIPRLLSQLVAGGQRHDVITRLITDIADAATRRLIAMAEAELGPPPAPYLWLACGSQGRQEQTGTSDQDNCLILDDSTEAADLPYFKALAQHVCAGLDACGYVYCPGDMMATNPRWRQPLSVWQGYFDDWIANPSPEAQMLASVMFDLRPISGTQALFEGLHARVLERAAQNSIFVAHMTRNALTHMPPLGLWRGLATIRSGEHARTLDLKHKGVVPITDLARLYALQARIKPVNTRARLSAAQQAGRISASGTRDLIDAYDLIAETRLAHQAAQARSGTAPDNYLAPTSLSDLERSHLRDAFVVVKSMQAAAAQNAPR